MAVYVRGSGGHVAERISPEPGSDHERELDQMAADPASDWRRIDDGGEVGLGTAPSTPPEPDPGKRPAQAASKETWVDWAVAHGMERGVADDLTKAELIKLADDLDKE